LVSVAHWFAAGVRDDCDKTLHSAYSTSRGWRADRRIHEEVLGTHGPELAWPLCVSPWPSLDATAASRVPLLGSRLMRPPG